MRATLGWRFRWVVLALALGAALTLVDTSTSSVITAASDTDTDLALYQGVVEDLKAGTPYYDALGDGLRDGEFPLRPIFNWRTPLHLKLLSWIGAGAAIALLGVLLLAGAVSWLPHFDANGPKRLAVGVLLLLISCFPLLNTPSVHFSETWCAAALLLCFGLRSNGAYRSAVVAGLVALLFRELAAPWLVAATLIDLSQRRYRIVGFWAGAAALYAVYYGIHAYQVNAHLLPTDVEVRSWVSVGGLRFALETLELFTLTAPFPGLRPWVLGAAIAACVGLIRAKDRALPIALLAWFGFLCLFGRSANTYWGVIAAPLLAVVLSRFPLGSAESTARERVAATQRTSETEPATQP